MRTKTITYDDFGVQASVTVAHASVAMGLERSRLTDEGLRNQDEDKSAYERTALWMQWPVIKAGITGGLIRFVDDEGKAERDIDLPGGLTFEDFLVLPEELAMTILGDILELNPHWSLTGLPRDDSPGKRQSGAGSKTNSDAA
jgi:hypothetical protein